MGAGGFEVSLLEFGLGRRRAGESEAAPQTSDHELASEMSISPGQVSALLANAHDERLIVKQGAGYALEK